MCMRYQYDPLPTSTSIRLFRVLGEDHNGLLRCLLETVDLIDNPKYYCLSYTWGNPHAQGTVFGFTDEIAEEYGPQTLWPIAVNDSLLLIRTNLMDALRSLPAEPWNWITGPGGKTPLHRLAERGQALMLSRIKQSGADINLQDDLGQTALHYAAYGGHRHTVRILLEEGANVHTLNRAGQSALDLALENQHAHVVELMLDFEPPTADTNAGEDLSPRFYPIGNWIDATCINQEDIRERSAQVGMMDRIYKSCGLCTIWLGREDMHTEIAIGVLEKLRHTAKNMFNNDILPYRFRPPEQYNNAGMAYISLRQWDASTMGRSCSTVPACLVPQSLDHPRSPFDGRRRSILRQALYPMAYSIACHERHSKTR